AGVLDSRDDAYPGGVKLYRRDSNSDGEWSLVGGAASANSSTGVVTYNNIAQFSQFVLIEDESALPVELSSFTASAEDNKVTLKWKTETEVENYGFEIERSRKSEVRSQNSEIRNVEWEKVGFVEGAGNSNSPKEYSFIDDLNHYLTLTRLTYRLKQIDTDGSFKYSDEVEVDVKLIPTEFALAQNYPNPFNPVTVISWQLPVSSKVMLKIYDILGNEVSILVNEEQAAGNYEVKFDGSNLSSGIYYYRIQAANFVNTRKLILLK
ncbi:MAG: T9SS C-terminal target domain-containing protein, partial [Ignavibacteriales bacterium]